MYHRFNRGINAVIVLACVILGGQHLWAQSGSTNFHQAALQKEADLIARSRDFGLIDSATEERPALDALTKEGLTAVYRELISSKAACAFFKNQSTQGLIIVSCPELDVEAMPESPFYASVSDMKDILGSARGTNTFSVRFACKPYRSIGASCINMNAWVGEEPVGTKGIQGEIWLRHAGAYWQSNISFAARLEKGKWTIVEMRVSGCGS